MVLGLYYLTKAKKNAKGEGRVFANYEEVLMALEAKEVETLSPIRLRYTGKVMDLTTAYDDQDLTHIEPVDFQQAVHFDDGGPRDSERRAAGGDAVHQRPAEEKGHRAIGKLL